MAKTLLLETFLKNDLINRGVMESPGSAPLTVNISYISGNLGNMSLASTPNFSFPKDLEEYFHLKLKVVKWRSITGCELLTIVFLNWCDLFDLGKEKKKHLSSLPSCCCYG